MTRRLRRAAPAAMAVAVWLLAQDHSLSAETAAQLQNARVGVTFDLTRGTYDLLDVASGQAAIKGAHAAVEQWSSHDPAYSRTAKITDVTDELGKGRSLTVECTAAGKPSLLVEFRVYGDERPFVVLRGGWKNTGREPLRVHEFRPLAGGQVFAGGTWREVRTLTSNSSFNDPQVIRSPYASSANNLLLTLKRYGVRRSLVLGALKTADFTKFAHTLTEGGLASRDLHLPGAHLVGYLDCGDPLSHSPAFRVACGSPYAWEGAKRPWGTVLFHSKQVVIQVQGLDPQKRYALGFSWWDYDANGRVQSVIVTGADSKPHTLLEDYALPQQPSPVEMAAAIPAGCYPDGTLTIAFVNKADVPNAVVSEIWLWETDKALPEEWMQGRPVKEAPAAPKGPVIADLEATDPVGKLTEAGERYLPEDSFYVDFLTPDPFAALEDYGWQLRLATHARPHLYDFPTVCAWYAGVWRTKGAQNHPDKSTYKINTTAGLVEEAEKIEASGFLNYSRAAARLVPDNYTPNNPQGWWDDEHWRREGFYTAPYETTAKYGQGMHRHGCLAFSYIQPPGSLISKDFRTQHVDWLCGKDIKRTLDFTNPQVQRYLGKVFGGLRGNIDGLMVDYCDNLWQQEASRGGFADPHVTSTAFYRTFLRIVKEELGPHSWLHERNIQQPNNDLTLGITDSQRTAWDTDKISPELVSRSGLRWYKNRVVLSYDMDSKELSEAWKVDGWTGDDRDGRRMMLTMAYVAASRLLTANSFRDLSPETLRDLSRTFPYPTEPRASARPLDAFVHEGSPRVYDFAVTADWHQLTLYNTTLPTRRETFSVPLAGEPASGAMGLDPDKEYYFYDFWNDCFAGRLRGDATLVEELRPGEARMISVHAVEQHPQLIATDRHLMQGYLDLVKRPVWDPQNKTLCGVSRLVAGDPYRVIIATNGLKPLTASAAGAAAKVEIIDAANGLAGLTLCGPANADSQWIVRFQ